MTKVFYLRNRKNNQFLNKGKTGYTSRTTKDAFAFATEDQAIDYITETGADLDYTKVIGIASREEE